MKTLIANSTSALSELSMHRLLAEITDPILGQILICIEFNAETSELVMEYRTPSGDLVDRKPRIVLNLNDCGEDEIKMRAVVDCQINPNGTTTKGWRYALCGPFRTGNPPS